MAWIEESVLLQETRAPLPARVSSRVISAGLLILCGVAALAMDLPLADVCRDGDLPGDLVRLIHLSEVFAHGAGVAMILLTAWTLDRANRRKLVRVAACAYGSGLLAAAGKLIVARSRPNGFGDGASVFDTFQAWLPFLAGRLPKGWEEGMQGFPSAHAATAVGFGLALATVYPRGRWLFLTFAGLASFQRVASGAHFLSDILAGAAVGCLGATLFLPGGWAAAWFDRWESVRSKG